MTLLNPSQVLKLNINGAVFSSLKEEDKETVFVFHAENFTYIFFVFTSYTPPKLLLFSI